MKKLISRRAQRGAVFVEAIIVVSFFTLCFLGVLYFREVYLAKLRVQRLARASAMAHAMGSCDVDAKAGLDKDLGTVAPGQTPGDGTPLPLDFPPGEGAGKAKDVLSGFSRTQGGTPLDKTTKITLTTTAAATTKKDQAPQREGFQSEVASASFVTCMDPASGGGVGDVIPRLADILKSFF